MREDMDEIIIERPRWGSRISYRRRAARFDGKVEARRDPEGLPFRIGLKRAARESGQPKSLNENLRPLERYLESQIARPWDKVWSEISGNLRVTSAVQQHVRDHVADFVAIRVVAKGGALWVPHRGGRLFRLEDSYVRMYVDPRTGLLRRNKHFKSWNRKRRDEQAVAVRQLAERMREVSPGLQLHRFDDGTWWEVRLAPVPTETVKVDNTGRTVNRVLPHTDVVRGTSLTRLPPGELYGRWDVYAVAKRQLSRKEMRALGLPRLTSATPRPRSSSAARLRRPVSQRTRRCP